MSIQEVAGIDLSLRSTGITRLCWEETSDGHELLYPFQRRITSEGTANDTLAQTHARLQRIAYAVCEEVDQADIVVIEGLSYGSVGGKSHDRTGLWWMTLDALKAVGGRDIANSVAVVSSAQRQMYAVGKGGGPTAAKDRVLAAVLKRYPHHWGIDGNDLADSTLLAAMGARAYGRPVEDSLPQTHLAAMAKVAWPPAYERNTTP